MGSEKRADAQELRAKLEALCKEDVSVASMATQLGMKRQSVYYYLNQYGLQPLHVKRKEKVLEAVGEEILQSMEEVYDLADRLEEDWSKVLSIVKSAGLYHVETRKAFIDKVSKRDLYHLYVVKDLSLRDIAKIYGTKSYQSVRSALEHYDIPVRPPNTTTVETCARQEWRARARMAMEMER